MTDRSCPGPECSIARWTRGSFGGGLPSIEFVPWGQIDPLFEAVVQAVEEAVLNALVAARTMIGRDGHRSPGFPVDRLPGLLGQ